MKYQRLIEIYVKPDLHQKIIKLKGTKTSDQFLRELLENGNTPDRKGLRHGNQETTKRQPGGS